jgi:hypothetical protein
MKKFTFLAAALVTLSAANASAVINTPVAERHATFSFDAPVEFNERGITFFIFPDGQFDFNTTATASSTLLYRNGHRTVNTTYGAAGFSEGGVRIEHDANGLVRRIGNVFLNYDRDGRIKRIGNVYVSYDRDRMVQIGGLRLIYDRRGRLIDMTGSVNGYSAQACNHWNTGGAYYGPVNGNINDNWYYKNGMIPARK